jgi:hypothetical protein
MCRNPRLIHVDSRELSGEISSLPSVPPNPKRGMVYQNLNPPKQSRGKSPRTGNETLRALIELSRPQP